MRKEYAIVNRMVEENTGEVTTAVDMLLKSLMPIEGELEASSFPPLEAQVPGLTITRAGGTLAFTSEGILQGLPFFLHSRRGTATLSLGLEPTETPLYSASIDFTPNGEQVSEEEFHQIFLRLVQKLDRAPFAYSFRGRGVRIVGGEGKLELLPEETDETFTATAHTPEAAFRAISTPDSRLNSIGLSNKIQKEIFKLQNVNPTPIREDDRVFPDPEPVFTVTA